MKTNYQMSKDWLYRAEMSDTPEERAICLATAQVYATLALTDATRGE